MLQNNPELKSKIDQLWNKFWSGGILYAAIDCVNEFSLLKV